MYGSELRRPDRKYTAIFDFMVYSREIFDVFSDLTKTLTLAFSRTLEKTRSFKLCMIITLFRVLHIRIMFDDLTLASWSQVCQRHELHIGFLDSCPV